MSMSRSVYLTNDKPLSKQALYQQKLKQGVFNSPGGPSVGVNSNASDTAALLAASTDLTVKPSYERTVAQEAQEAALAAKLEKVYQWSRTVDGNAASAASAGLNDYNKRLNTISSTTTYQSSSSQLGVPTSMKGSNIYQVANKNSSSTMTSRINPEKNHRHGLLPKGSSTELNIGKISSLANANSAKTMTSRTNPTLNSSRSGLVKQDRAKSFQAGDISGQYLLSAASEKAQNRLDSLSSSGTPQDFKAQAQAYANALTIAQKRSEERVAENKKGLIQLGGGLTVTQAELDAMASLIVQPVLSDIDSKAKTQRDSDLAAKKEKEELVKKHQQAKQAEIAAKEQEKTDFEKAKQDRLAQNNKDKQTKDEEYAAYQEEEQKKIEAKVAELKEQEAKHAEAKELLITEKQENQDKIDNEELELIASRKKVLDDMQAERDEEIAPLLEELKTETGKLKELTDAKTELSDEVDKLTTLNEEYTSKLKELEEKLKSTEEDIDANTKNLEESTTALEESNKEIEELEKSTDTDLKALDDEDKKLDEEIENLKKTKEEHLSNKDSQKKEIKELLQQRVKEEHEINNELPEHLRKDVNEKKLTDASSIFSDFEPEPEVKPKVKSEPKKAAATPTPAPATTKVKKESRMKRLSKFLRGGPPSPTKTPAKTTESKPVSKATPKPATTTETKSELKPETKDTGKKEVEKSPKTSHSYEGYEDEISVNQNKGGLFKEEI